MQLLKLITQLKPDLPVTNSVHILVPRLLPVFVFLRIALKNWEEPGDDATLYIKGIVPRYKV